MTALRLRKLAGAVMLLVLITVYVLLVTALSGTVLPLAGNGIWQFLFYALAGLAWVPPAALIVSWMHRSG